MTNWDASNYCDLTCRINEDKPCLPTPFRKRCLRLLRLIFAPQLFNGVFTCAEKRGRDVTVGRLLNIPKGSMVLIDEVYSDST